MRFLQYAVFPRKLKTHKPRTKCNISIIYLGLAKPAQKKNANLPNSGGCMVIKPEVDDGAAGGGFIDRLIDATDSMAKR